MHQFVVIDHSIKRIGGHNYEYAFHVLTAAERQHYQPVLAVNRRFFERARLPASWRLLAPFRHTTYECHKLAAKQRRIDPGGEFRGRATMAGASGGSTTVRQPMLPRWFRRGMVQRYEMQRLKIIERYAEDMAALFKQLSLRPGDQLFLPTLSEEDLSGLLGFFREHSRTASGLEWHLQFHFKVYDGRHADYDAQDAKLVELKQLLQDLTRAQPAGHIRLYTTTDILAAQFARLGVQVLPLPYPVNPALLHKSAQSRQSVRPLRVTSAGAIRPEKGPSLLHRAVQTLWDECFETGRMQLVVQAKRIGKLPAQLRRYARYDRHPNAASDSQAAKIAVVRWPLSTEHYLHLIRQSHIGLFLYDAREYYARCSGVMVEMLKAAVPVIVPAGCWMGEQIAEPVYAHRDALVQSSGLVRRMSAADADWEPAGAQRYYIWRPNARLLVEGTDVPLTARLDVSKGATHLCIRFRWSDSTERGSYLDVRSGQFAENGAQVSSEREIVGLRNSDDRVPLLMSLAPEARWVELEWRNAYAKNALELAELEFIFLSAPENGYPLGAVGLIAADIDQVPRLLRNMAEHYEHYRRSAEAFAPAWGDWHSPERVVRLLTAAAHPDERSRVAA